MFFKPFPLPEVPVFSKNEASIKDFGAVESKICTDAIVKAIDHIHKAGGGRVTVPEGNWQTGPIHMKSGVELHIACGAVLSFTEELSAYLPVVLTNYEGIRCYNYSPMIYGRDLENVAITGEGRLEGNGSAWWEWSKHTMRGRDRLYAMMRDKTPVEERIFGTDEDGLRSPFVQFLNCKNLLIENIYLQNSPFWTVHIVWSENVTVRGVTIKSQTKSPNTDGINIDACNRVLVEDCTAITLGDDMFCIKAGRNEDAWDVGLPCENVVIRHCRGIGKCTSGGIVIGSEMSGSVRNILAHDCEFEENLNCVRIKSKDGRGGVIENVDFKNLSMKRGLRGINYTFRYSCEATDAPSESGQHLPILRNVCAEGVFCEKTELGIAIDGIPGGEMQNLVFKDIRMYAKICFTADTVDGLTMENVHLYEISE